MVKSKRQSAVRDRSRQWLTFSNVIIRKIQATVSHCALIVRLTAGAFSLPPQTSHLQLLLLHPSRFSRTCRIISKQLLRKRPTRTCSCELPLFPDYLPRWVSDDRIGRQYLVSDWYLSRFLEKIAPVQAKCCVHILNCDCAPQSGDVTPPLKLQQLNCNRSLVSIKIFFFFFWSGFSTGTM